MSAMLMTFIVVFMMWYHVTLVYLYNVRHSIKSKEEKKERMQWLFRITRESDIHCVSILHMDRRTFGILCDMVRDFGGLRPTRNMSLEEIVAMFVYTLAHHEKNRTIGLTFLRSGETVSRQFNLCLLAVLKLHDLLLENPEPITDECTDDRWKYFKVLYIVN